MTIDLETDLAALREDAKATFMDTCGIAVGAESINFDIDPGLEAAPDSFGGDVPCGFKYVSNMEKGDGTQTVIVNVMLRLAIGTTVNSSSRIEHRKRHDTTLSPYVIYSIIGEPEIGPSAIVCHLKYVGPGGVAS